MGFGMSVLAYEDEVRINFLKAVRPGEFENFLHSRNLMIGDREEKMRKLFEFSDRILFDQRNEASLRAIIPQGPLVRLWKFFLSEKTDPDLISENPSILKFKDYQTGIIYEISRLSLMPFI